MLYILLGLMFKVFFVVITAYVLYRQGILTAQDRKSITNVLMKMVIYFTVLRSAQQAFSLEAAHAILVTALYAIIFFVVFIPCAIFLSKRLKLEEKKRRVFVSSIVFGNITFVGYPILQELYGNIGLLCAITFSMVYNLLFYIWGIRYLGESGRLNLRCLLTNKIALASVLALAMYFLQIRIPEPFLSTFSVVGAMTMPLSMLIIGCHLAEAGIWKIIWEKDLYPATALRMLVIPAIVYLVMNILGADAMTIKISTVIAALPAGAMTTIVASDYNCAPGYAANIMVQTMLAMIVVLPLWVYVVGL